MFRGGTYTGNIDNIKETLFVWVDFATVTGAKPKTTGYGMICTFMITVNVLVQVEFDYYSTAGTPIIRYRMFANNQWYKWTEFTGTLLTA